MRKIFIVLMIVFSLFLLTGCENAAVENTAEEKQTAKTNQMMNEANRQIGMPDVVNFQMKKTLKMIFELTDKPNYICHAYVFSPMIGKFIYIGKCVGYGIPFSAQYTNPQKIIDPDDIPGQSYYSGEGTPAIVPQADPNGLYMPTSSSATWIMLIDPKTNKPEVTYMEPNLIVVPFKLPARIVL